MWLTASCFLSAYARRSAVEVMTQKIAATNFTFRRYRTLVVANTNIHRISNSEPTVEHRRYTRLLLSVSRNFCTLMVKLGKQCIWPRFGINRRCENKPMVILLLFNRDSGVGTDILSFWRHFFLKVTVQSHGRKSCPQGNHPSSSSSRAVISRRR